MTYVGDDAFFGANIFFTVVYGENFLNCTKFAQWLCLQETNKWLKCHNSCKQLTLDRKWRLLLQLLPPSVISFNSIFLINWVWIIRVVSTLVELLIFWRQISKKLKRSLNLVDFLAPISRILLTVYLIGSPVSIHRELFYQRKDVSP